MNSAVADKPATIPWWLVLIQGLAIIFIGIMLLTKPFMASAIVVWSIGLYWIITGIISLVRIFTDRGHTFWKLFSGIIGILAGWFLVSNIQDDTVWVLGVFGVTVIIVLAIQGIIMGIIGLIEAFQGGGWGPGILGAISIIIGILLLGTPLVYAAALPWVVGIFAIVGGIFAVIMAFRLRSA